MSHRADHSENVCSLPADEQRDRVTRIRREILPEVTRRQALPDGVALEFEHTPALQEALEELVSFERGCCSALVWDLSRPAHGTLRLVIRGLPPDDEFFRTLIDAAPPQRGSNAPESSGSAAPAAQCTQRSFRGASRP